MRCWRSFTAAHDKLRRNHGTQKIIDSVKKQGQVAIKDLDEFLRFVINESDMRTYDDNYISILIPMKFDIDKVFGLDVCKEVMTTM